MPKTVPQPTNKPNDTTIRTMKKHLAPLAAAALITLTGCTTNNPTTATPTTENTNYTWASSDYPTNNPNLFIKEDPTSQNGWYMGHQENPTSTDSQPNNFNTWQTIYSYKDATDPRGATIAVIFYTDLERCTFSPGTTTVNAPKQYVQWVMQDRNHLNTAAYYQYVFNDEGRTYPHPNDTQPLAPGATDQTNTLKSESTRTPNPTVEDAEIYTTTASSTRGITAKDAIGTPGRTADFIANYTEDSTGEFVPTGCATVYTALSNEAAQTYDATKFAQAYEQAINFANEITSMPEKISTN